MLLDAFIFSPVAVAGYFTWRTVLEGGGPNDVMSKLQSKFIGTLFASLKFWPCVNIINFAFVPVEYRVLYNNMLSLFWSGYLSYINNIGRKWGCHWTAVCWYCNYLLDLYVCAVIKLGLGGAKKTIKSYNKQNLAVSSFRWDACLTCHLIEIVFSKGWVLMIHILFPQHMCAEGTTWSSLQL